MFVTKFLIDHHFATASISGQISTKPSSLHEIHIGGQNLRKMSIYLTILDHLPRPLCSVLTAPRH